MARLARSPRNEEPQEEIRYAQIDIRVFGYTVRECSN